MRSLRCMQCRRYLTTWMVIGRTEALTVPCSTRWEHEETGFLCKYAKATACVGKRFKRRGVTPDKRQLDLQTREIRARRHGEEVR